MTTKSSTKKLGETCKQWVRLEHITDPIEQISPYPSALEYMLKVTFQGKTHHISVLPHLFNEALHLPDRFVGLTIDGYWKAVECDEANDQSNEFPGAISLDDFKHQFREIKV